MVPKSRDLHLQAMKKFTDRPRDEFSEYYFAKAGIDDFWEIENLESCDALHVPVAIRCDERLADFRHIDEIAETILESTDFLNLVNRILKRFRGN